jgi:hypothetical protein
MTLHTLRPSQTAPLWAILLLATLLSTALQGCVSNSTQPTPYIPVVQGETTFSNTAIIYNNAEVIFSQAFRGKNEEWWKKQKFETDSEYRQRVVKAGEGLTGRYVTFLIAPEDCEYQANPEKRIYTIRPKSVSRTNMTKAPEVAIKSSTINLGKTPMQNAFGTSVMVSREHVERKAISIMNYQDLPRSVYSIPGSQYSPAFGLTFSLQGESASADTEFRKLLTDKKVAFAIAGRIGSFLNAGQEIYGGNATIKSPESWRVDSASIPLEIDEVSVVLMHNMRKIVQWSMTRSESK